MQSTRMLAVGVLALGWLAAGCTDSPSRVTDISGAVSLQAVAGAAQTAPAGSSVPVVPAVVLKDAAGAPLSGQQVAFVVTAGGGAVGNATTVTNSQGVASAGSWTLGATAGTNVLEARTAGAGSVQFTATATATTTSPPPAPGAGAYAITVRYLATPSARQQQAVANAVARWQQVITRDLADIPVMASANHCFTGQPAINERVDDMLLFVELVEIDGAGKVLGEAGPCYVRSNDGLPVVGHLKLDAADLRQMESYGTIDDVVLHEIGHVLGIGTLWPDKGLLQGAGGADPGFLGANAITEYRNLGGALAFVPVENTGSAGTRDGHWRESVFGTELMTGWVSRGSNPLSAMTIASLVDLGYGANTTVATTYTMSAYTSATMATRLGHENLKRPKFKIDRKGQKRQL